MSTGGTPVSREGILAFGDGDEEGVRGMRKGSGDPGVWGRDPYVRGGDPNVWEGDEEGVRGPWHLGRGPLCPGRGPWHLGTGIEEGVRGIEEGVRGPWCWEGTQRDEEGVRAPWRLGRGTLVAPPTPATGPAVTGTLPQRRLLGTLRGVAGPSLQTLLGLVLVLRLPWVVGTGGVLQVSAIGLLLGACVSGAGGRRSRAGGRRSRAGG